MEHVSSVKHVVYLIVTTSLFLGYPSFGYPDKVSSEDTTGDMSAEQFPTHQNYDPDSMPYYYDPGM